MNRRNFLQLKKASLKTGPDKVRGIQTGLIPYSGPWTINEAAHLLKRTMFGAKKTDIDAVLQLSVNDAVGELLTNIPVVAPPLRDYGLMEDAGSFYNDPMVNIGQTWVNDLNKTSPEPIRGAIDRNRMDTLPRWWVGLMVNQNRSITEKMILFWHHHFSVHKEEVNNATMLYRHHQLLRNNVLGNVRSLTRQTATDPAMLMHLNGYLNAKQAPDENYARELQELFTIGKGNNSLYTEEDVRSAARVLTGWRIDPDTYISSLKENDHDTASKTFSSFYSNTVINGGSDGAAEVDQLINMIFSTDECSLFICRKLYRWFIYSAIDEDTETNVIQPLANILRSANFEIRPVLAALFKSEHFFDVMNQACYIKSPYDFIVGTLREFNIPVPSSGDYALGYPIFESIYYKATEMRQQLFHPPDVSGWPAYYQEPMFYELWVNSNSLPRRAVFVNVLVEENILSLRNFAADTSNPAIAGDLVHEVSALLLRYPLSDNAKLYVKNRFLLNNTGNESVWTNAWNSNNNAVVDESLKGMFHFLTNLPEFQLC